MLPSLDMMKCLSRGSGLVHLLYLTFLLKFPLVIIIALSNVEQFGYQEISYQGVRAGSFALCRIERKSECLCTW